MEIHAVEYHRNGVAGKGFYVVQFTAENRRLVGVVFPTAWSDDDTVNTAETAVLDIDSLDTRLRGRDFWGADLIRAVGEADCSGSAYVHAGIGDED